MQPRPADDLLVIFDCDGVLVDSEPLAIAIDVQICSDYGWPITAEEVIERYMGRKAGLIWLDLEQRLGRPLTAAERAANSERFHSAYERELTAVSGAAEALGALPYAKCVGSSSEPQPLYWKLEHCGLLHHFGDHVYSASQVKHGKPAPDLFLFAAAQLGYEPAACVVVEDSPYGLQAARAAGMRSFALDTGMLPVSELQGPGTVVFDDMRQLPELLAAVAAGGPAGPPAS